MKILSPAPYFRDLMKPDSEYIQKRRGPKSKYEPWMCDKILEIADTGGGILQQMAAIGISSMDTYNRWKKEHKEFGEAAAAAKVISGAVTEHLLELHAAGKIKGDGRSLQWMLYNKAKDVYSMPGKPTSEINIGSINSIENLDGKALDKRIEELQRRLYHDSNLLEDSEGKGSVSSSSAD